MAKCLEIIGLSLASIGALLLSIDVLGKQRIYDFIKKWFEIFKGEWSFVITMAIACIFLIIVGAFQIIWDIKLNEGTFPLLYRHPTISLCVATIINLGIILLFWGGMNFRKILKKIITSLSTWYRRFEILINSNKRALLIRELKHKKSYDMYKTFESIVSRVFFYFIILGAPIIYLINKQQIFWNISTTVPIMSIGGLVLLFIASYLVRGGLKTLKFLIREDADKTVGMLTRIGFASLALGFVVQLVGVITR